MNSYAVSMGLLVQMVNVVSKSQNIDFILKNSNTLLHENAAVSWGVQKTAN